MRTVATNKSNLPDLDEAIYEFVVKSVEDATGGDAKFDKGFPRQVLTYKLNEVGEDGEPITVKQWVTIYPVMRPRSAIYGIFSALMFGGEPIPEDEDLDTDDLVGKRGRLFWGPVDKPDGTKTVGVNKVMPPSTKKAVGAGKRVTAEDIDAV